MDALSEERSRYVFSSHEEASIAFRLRRVWNNACQYFGSDDRAEYRSSTEYVVFSPQNYSTLFPLNLAGDTCYIRYLGRLEISEPSESESDVYDDIVNSAARLIMRDLYEYMAHAPLLADKLVNIFLRHIVITNCIRSEEVIPITRRCLNTLYGQAYSEGLLVTDVMFALCSTSQLHVEDLVSEYYPHHLFRYILESCAKVGFNFRNFLLHQPGRKRSCLMPVCPVLSNVLKGDNDYLKHLFEFGFERYELHMDSKNWSYQRLKMARILANQKVNIQLAYYNHYQQYLQRHILLMETLYLICASFKTDPNSWVQCARLLYGCIPDPYLSATELNNLLYPNCPTYYREKICLRCRSLFSDILVTTPTPRSLKHLSRCAIRKALGANFQLPYGADRVGLPRELVEYLTSLA